MDTLLGRYFWVVKLAAIAGCALFLGDAVARVVDAREVAFLPPRLLRPPPARPRVPVTVVGNPFCSSCADQPAPVAAPPSDLPLALVATMCTPRAADRRCPMALVRDLEAGSLRAFGLGDSLRDATVTDIQPTRVSLTRGGHAQTLELLTGAAEPPIELARPTPTVASALDIRTVGRESYEVPRATLDRLLGNLNLVAQSARILPEVRDGQAAGFRLVRVEPDGPLGRLELRNGDVVTAVNGLSLASADGALDAFVKLRSATHLSLGLERNGRRMSKEVRIR